MFDILKAKTMSLLIVCLDVKFLMFVVHICIILLKILKILLFDQNFPYWRGGVMYSHSFDV